MYRWMGGQMHFVDEGNGRPLVMVHGTPTWSFLYRTLIKELSGEFRVPIHSDHEPLHNRDLVARQPGLYFLGLHFQYAFSSTMIHGVGRDAVFIASQIDARMKETTAPAGLSSQQAAHR